MCVSYDLIGKRESDINTQLKNLLFVYERNEPKDII